MKKITAILSAFIVALSMAGCNKKTNTSSETSSIPASSSEVISASTESQQASWWEQEVMPLPLTQNPLTGLPLAEGYQQGQRPVAVIVANDAKALPQRGLAQADVIYEMLIEGDSTRLMAVYADYKTLPEVGPIRSAQDQFIQVAIPQNFILQYIDSTVYGNNLLVVEEYKTVDGINLGELAFKFDSNRFSSRYGHRNSEYCWFTDAGLLWNGMEQADIYTSAEEKSAFRFSAAAEEPGTDAYYIKAVYSPLSNASFEYDETTGIYNKNIFDAPHADEDGTRLSYVNVLLLNTQVGVKEDGQFIEYDFSSGEGFYFNSGKMQKIKWHKGGPDEQLKFADMEGNMLEIQAGKTYVGFVPTNPNTSITYTAKLEQAVEEVAPEVEPVPEEAVQNPEGV